MQRGRMRRLEFLYMRIELVDGQIVPGIRNQTPAQYRIFTGISQGKAGEILIVIRYRPGVKSS